ncbi:MAG: methionine--tRNA ligase subunit beta, partial [Clostridia bacterium]
VQGLVREANRYIEERQPWALHRDPATRELLDDVLYNLAEVLRVISVLLTPFLVEAPSRMRHALGLGDEPVVWADVAWGGLAAGSAVQVGEPLFRRIEETEQGGEPPAEERAEPEPELLSIDDFRRWDLRVARVQACTRVENADRLLRLTLELGSESRTVVSGIAQHYAPADLVGKSVVVVTNLKPATIRGIRSEGMILAASDASGRLAIVGPWSDVQSGSRVT